MTKLIYTASPIDRHVMDEPIKAVIDRVTSALAESGAVVFHPERAFKVPDTRVHEPSGHVREINNRALDISQGLLVFYPVGVRTWGVPAEIERALLQRKQVAFIVIGDEPLSWSQMYTEAVYFRYPSVAGFLQGEPALVDALRNVFDLSTPEVVEPEEPSFDEVISQSQEGVS